MEQQSCLILDAPLQDIPFGEAERFRQNHRQVDVVRAALPTGERSEAFERRRYGKHLVEIGDFDESCHVRIGLGVGIEHDECALVG